jgi:hypothetical protein
MWIWINQLKLLLLQTETSRNFTRGRQTQSC